MNCIFILLYGKSPSYLRPLNLRVGIHEPGLSLWSRRGCLCFVTSGYRSVMGVSVCFLQQGNDSHHPAAQMSRTRDQKPSMRSVWREEGHLSPEVTATQEGDMLWGSAVETFQNTPWRFWNVGCTNIATMLTRAMPRKWLFPRRQILQCCR